MSIAHHFAPSQLSKLKLERGESKMPYIIVRETDTGVLVEGLCYAECSETAALSQVNMMTSFEHFFIILIHSKIDMEIRDEANLRFVFDTDVNSLINVLETRGKTKRNFFSDFILENILQISNCNF